MTGRSLPQTAKGQAQTGSELVFAVGLCLLSTTAFKFIGLGTTAQAIGHVTFPLSFVVVIVRGRLATIGTDLEEAAADLGAPPCGAATHPAGSVIALNGRNAAMAVLEDGGESLG